MFSRAAARNAREAEERAAGYAERNLTVCKFVEKTFNRIIFS